MTDKPKSAADECADLITLAQVQMVHVEAGLAQWHELATTARKIEDAAMRAAKEELDREVCIDGYPEHDWKVMDERDGIRTLACRRCGAEASEEAA